MLDRAHLTTLASRVIVLLAGGFSTMITARGLGAEGFGVFSAGLAVSTLTVYIGSLGADQLYLLGNIDADVFRRQCRRIAIAVGVLGVVLARTFPLPEAARIPTLLLTLSAAAGILRMPWLVEPQRNLDFGLRARRDMVSQLATAFASSVAALAFHDPLAVAISMLGTALAIAVIADRRRVGGGHRWEGARLIRPGLGFALSGALFTVYFQIDQVFVAAMLPSIEAGRYRAIFSLVRVGFALAAALHNDILRPRMYRTGGEGAKVLERQGLILALLCGFGVGGGGAVLAGPLLRVGFGSEFATAASVASLSMCSLIPHFFNSYAANVLMARRHVAAVLRVQGILVLVNLVANALLIPRYGISGAAGATVGTEVLAAAFYAVLLRTRPWRATDVCAGEGTTVNEFNKEAA